MPLERLTWGRAAHSGNDAGLRKKRGSYALMEMQKAQRQDGSMTAEQRLQFIQDQFDQIWTNGYAMAIDCPYCYAHVEPGESVCCALMDKAARALIERAKVVEEGMETFERRQLGRMIMGGDYVN